MLKNKSIILGIDFGTTNSVVSYYDKGPVVLKDGINSLIPSKVYMGEKKYFGNHIPSKLSINRSLLIENFKSKIHDSGASIETCEIIKLYFRYLFTIVKEKFNDVTDFQAVLTVPSNFNDIQRNIILNNAKSSGFDVIRLINEPTAAAFSYGLDRIEWNQCDESSDNNILVFDIGGGTFDVSLMEVSLEEDNCFFEVVDSFGFNNLGGNNFTDEIYKYINKNESDQSNSLNRESKLWQECNKVKEKLSYLKRVEYNNFIFDSNNFKDICRNLLDSIKNEIWIKNMVNNVKEDKIKITKILMVGGSSKLEMIQDLIHELFNLKPMVHNQLQHVVSLGACYYGALIKNKLDNFGDIILIDTLPLSLGVETADGNLSVIIPKNTPLPASRSEKYTTDILGEENIIVKIYQGEKNVAKKNNFVGEINFDKLSLSTNPVINISFRVDVNGLISVCIEDTKTKESKNVLIKSDIDSLDSLKMSELNNEDFEDIKLDEKESKILELSYKIRTKIENLLNNHSSNSNSSLLDEESLDYFSNLLDIVYDTDNLEEKITIPQLIKINTNLDDKYFLMINNSENTTKLNDSETDGQSELNKSYFDVDNIILEEKLNTLSSKIDHYLTKLDPDKDNFKIDCLNDIIKKIENKNKKLLLNQEFVDEQLKFIIELFSDNYRDELENLCTFLNTGIENNEIPSNIELIEVINKNLNNLKSESCEDNYYYLNQINIINKICEELQKNI